MSGAVLIFLFALVVFVCAVAIARRVGEQESQRQQYLDSPSWQGSMAGGATRTDLTAPAAATPATVPQGARIRAPDASSAASGAARRQDRLVDEVVRGLARIPPLPHVLFNVMRELDHAGSSARSLSAIVSTEPVLAASLLRVANSAATGLQRRIISVDEAVAYLGFSNVRSLVLRMKLAELMPQRAVRGYDSERLWMHSLVVAQVAAHLAKRVGGGVDGWLVSTIGLLHDIGKLAINSQFPDTVSQLWTPTNATAAAPSILPDPVTPADESFLARERRLFGADHAFIGAFLAAQWKLPTELVDAIRLHHLPWPDCLATVSPELGRAIQVVHVANQLAKYAQVYCADMEIDIVPPALLEGLGLPGDLELLLDNDLRAVIRRGASLSGLNNELTFGEDDAVRAISEPPPPPLRGAA